MHIHAYSSMPPGFPRFWETLSKICIFYKYATRFPTFGETLSKNSTFSEGAATTTTAAAAAEEFFEQARSQSHRAQEKIHVSGNPSLRLTT